MSTVGSALRLLPRLDRRTCDLGDLVDAARLLVAVGRPGLRLVLDEDDPRRPELVVEEEERSWRTDLADLAGRIVGSQLDLGPAGLAAALDRWLDERPVTDAEAARRGIAVLGWSGVAGEELTWQVAVRRRTGLMSWTAAPVHRRPRRADRPGGGPGPGRRRGGALHGRGTRCCCWTPTRRTWRRRR